MCFEIMSFFVKKLDEKDLTLGIDRYNYTILRNYIIYFKGDILSKLSNPFCNNKKLYNKLIKSKIHYKKNFKIELIPILIYFDKFFLAYICVLIFSK